MEKYSVSGSAAVGTDKTLINLFAVPATPSKRGRIYDLVCGGATAADQGTNFALQRTTANGTEGSGFVPVAVDGAAPASDYDAGIAHTVEPTLTANAFLIRFPIHRRATFRWIAHPGGEFVLPATQNAGAAWKSSSSEGTGSYLATILFME